MPGPLGPAIIVNGRTVYWSQDWEEYVIGLVDDEIVDGFEVALSVNDPPQENENGPMQDANGVTSLTADVWEDGVPTRLGSYAWQYITFQDRVGWTNTDADGGLDGSGPGFALPVGFSPYTILSTGDWYRYPELDYVKDHIGSQFNPEQRPTLGYNL
jgi:hypothetical protein